jgi:hypothetical protein
MAGSASVAVGERFGRLTVVRVIPAVHRAECSCSCGGTKSIRVYDLAGGAGTKSCGCLQRDTTRQRNLTHGLRHHYLYSIWRQMVARCGDPRHKHWPGYGGRGIRVCERWHDVAAFIADIEAQIGPRPSGKGPAGRAAYSLDRIDNDGHYEPGNVRWATAKQQRGNQRG